LPPPPFVHSLSHKFGQYRALVLTPKGLVERFLNIGWHAKIHSGHRKAPVVECFNNRMAVHGLAVKIEGSPQPRSFEAYTSETSSVSLVDLVCFVYVVYLVHRVSSRSTKKPDRPDKPNNSLLILADFLASC
jgi:hypothetical protein